MNLEKMIAHVNDTEIVSVIDACTKRYAELFPSYEINYFSIPRDEDRNTHIDRVISVLQGLKQQSKKDGT